ncbi:MAG: hypothetical protein E7361_00040 [Clostridiales bacterium]|nr:hypothetical protein [Clostridiales bacterium]
MDLKCKKLDCEHNDKYSCMKDTIQVTGSAECDSYVKDGKVREGQTQNASRDMFEVAPDYHPYRHKRQVDIECGAECLFNINNHCRANGISVCNCKDIALCTTFIKK